MAEGNRIWLDRISTSYGTQPSVLSWGYYNIEKHEDRVKLANAAHTALAKEQCKDYSKEDLRRDLDKFCKGVWDFSLLNYMPVLVQGNEDIKPLRFLLKPYILEGGGTILFAPPGRGKSYTALIWAVSIDAGVSKFWPVNQGKVLFVNLERSRQSLQRRLAMVNKVLGLSPTRELLILNARGKSLSEVMPACRKAIEKHGIKLMVLDSISRAGYGDLTENRPVNAIIDALSSLCDTWLALGHTPRADEGHIFGGIHFDAGADIVVQLSAQQGENETLGIGWQIVKKNDLPDYPQSIYALEFGELGLTNLRKAKPYEFPEVEGKQKKSMIDQVTEYILEQDTSDASASQIEAALGFNRSNVSHTLRNSGRFVETRKVKSEVFYGVKTS
jgi:hypothetical protein